MNTDRFYKNFGRVKVLGLDANLFRIYYRESPEVYEILDNHIKYSQHDADEDLFYLTFKDCLLTYNTETGDLSIHLVDNDGNDEFVMNLKPENYREVVIQ